MRGSGVEGGNRRIWLDVSIHLALPETKSKTPRLLNRTTAIWITGPKLSGSLLKIGALHGMPSVLHGRNGLDPGGLRARG